VTVARPYARVSARARQLVAQNGRLGSALVGAVAFSLAASASSPVKAQDSVACADLPQPIIYGRGGSAPNQLVGRLAVEIAESSDPFTVVYQDSGACFAMSSLVEGEKVKSTAKYWVREDGKIAIKTCTLPSDDSAPDASWGSMAQQATTCPGIPGLPSDVGDYIGPISGFSLVVPKASTQQVISAEAVYYIYGFGPENPAYQVPPWTVPGAIASRTTTSAAGLLLAKAVGLPLSHSLYGSVGPNNTAGPNDVKTNQGAVEWVTGVTSDAAKNNPEAAIGFCSTETADANRDRVNTLAFQAAGQNAGYWPDSTATALDKINIREGRYYLWNPHHFYARLNNEGEIADETTRRWIEYITGKRPLPDGKNYLDIQADLGLIPACAMKVTRTDDVGPLSSFVPDEPCGCYYEARVTGKTPEGCQACATEGEDPSCPSDAPVCRHGFCEVK
jgi:hypothetical protein